MTRRRSLLLSGLPVLILVPFIASAQEYLPLSAIPGVQETGGSLASYINALFLISISVGALLAVVKIAIGGVQYMMTDVVTTKQDAKETITGALLGLGILLATYVVLWAINPNLVSLDVLSGADPIQLQPIANPNQGSPSNDPLAGYTTIDEDDTLRSCGQLSATECATERCDPAGGTVVTSGIVSESGSIVKPTGQAVCIIRHGTTPTEEQTELTIDPNTQYTLTEMQSFIQRALEMGIYIADYPLGTGNPPSYGQEVCESRYGGTTAHVIKRQPPGETHVLCTSS